MSARVYVLEGGGLLVIDAGQEIVVASPEVADGQSAADVAEHFRERAAAIDGAAYDIKLAQERAKAGSDGK